MLKGMTVLHCNHMAIFERVVPGRRSTYVCHDKTTRNVLSNVAQISITPGRCDKLEHTTSLLGGLLVPGDAESVSIDENVSPVLVVVRDSGVISRVPALTDEAIFWPYNKVTDEHLPSLVKSKTAHS